MGASLAAHEEARRLDPTVPTSAEYSVLLLGDSERLATMDAPLDFNGAHGYLLMYLGKVDEMRKLLGNTNVDHMPPGYRGMIEAIRAMPADPTVTLAAMDDAMAIGAKEDPEAVFLVALTAALLGVPDRAVQMIDEAIMNGYTPVHALVHAPVLDNIRAHPTFQAALERARARQRIALAIFERGDGPSLLGISAGHAV